MFLVVARSLTPLPPPHPFPLTAIVDFHRSREDASLSTLKMPTVKGADIAKEENPPPAGRAQLKRPALAKDVFRRPRRVGLFGRKAGR